jgi:hypothetical protein
MCPGDVMAHLGFHPGELAWADRLVTKVCLRSSCGKPFLACGVFLISGLAGCGGGEPRAPVIGEAYAGPATLALRKEIPLQSPVVATLKHGEKLEIVGRRRAFLKVRTAAGVEGWTSERLLLSSQEIAALKDVERRARTLPSQGVASTYDMLNVHSEANRYSPSFLQIKAGEKVDVLGHVIAPRTPPERQPLIPRKPRRKEPRKVDTKYALPPLPPPPQPPANWRALSQTPPEVLQEIAQEKAEHPVPTDDWSLVRTAKGQSGWVLTRRLYMAIPDEVAQYAEGHRITSYFSLGDVPDGDQVKHNWLWTTIGGGDHNYDFDSFRVFIWSLRRHRYETAYIQRNVEGYFPVLLQPVELSTGAKTRGAPVVTRYPGFSVCLSGDSGARIRRSYAFIVNIVRFAGEQPCAPGGNLLPGEGAPGEAPAVPPGAKPVPASLYSRLKSGLGTLVRKWFDR